MNEMAAFFTPTGTDLVIVGVVTGIGVAAYGLQRLAAPLERSVPSWLALLAFVALFVALGLIAGRLS